MVLAVVGLECCVIAEFENAWWDFGEGCGEDYDLEFWGEEGEEVECCEGGGGYFLGWGLFLDVINLFAGSFKKNLQLVLDFRNDPEGGRHGCWRLLDLGSWQVNLKRMLLRKS